MVLTAAQTASFFENDDQMGIPHATVVQMQTEGITVVGDLEGFDKETLQQLADNLRRPGGRIPDPNPNAVPGATIPTPPFTFGAKSQKRLAVACDLVRFYVTVGRDLTQANIRWTHVMSNFETQWKALKAKKDGDTPEVPKINRSLPVIKWTEAFQDFLHRVIGVRIIPLYYVIRPVVVVPQAAPALAPNQPHSTEHGSVEDELVARASHDHALFRDDNASVYHYLEEATRSTAYAASIKPFQRTKNGRGAWMALIGQYAGNDKWEAEIKKQEQLLHSKIWKGQSNQSLEVFISQHRNAFVSMQACAEHIEFQLPNEHSRVGFLLDGIQCSDAGLQAAMASVQVATGPGGMRNNFEATAAHLLPYDPVAKKRNNTNKRDSAQLSATEAEIAGTNAKPGIGKTGVHLRYHKQAEYDALTKAQKAELYAYKEKHPEEFKRPRKPNDKKGKRMTVKQQIAAALAKQKEEDQKQGQSQEEAEAYVMSLIHKCNQQTRAPAASSIGAAAAASSTPTHPPSTLNGILKRARFA